MWSMPLVADSEIPVVPRPSQVKLAGGEFHLTFRTAIQADASCVPVAQLFARQIAPATGFTLRILRADNPRINSIVLVVDSILSRLGEEGYILEVTPKRVTIRASTSTGIFYGLQSFRQLLPPSVFGSEVKNQMWAVPCLRIEDHPRFGWRGAMIDTARHFMPKSDVLRFIDAMACLKLNVLHLHLTDDQGWRIDISRYPKLTQIGSLRKATWVGHERGNGGLDGKPHGGFYSKADIAEMVAYASERFITVVPEIEMPGHCQAALAAYPELGNTGAQLEVSPRWGINKNIYNADEKTITFLQDVLGDVLAMFPSKFIHVGGDEVPKDQWQASPQVQARMRELKLKDENALQSYFIRRMDQYLTAHGRRLVGWDEILEGGLAPGATVMSWRGMQGGLAAARAGHDVIMAPTQYTYFDYYQSKDPSEPLAIGSFLPLDKVYEFEPVPADLRAEEVHHILGAQGQLWTEYIGTPQYFEYMAFPRLAALAEVVWTAAARKDYRSFVPRLRVQEERWKLAGVKFRPLERSK
jgi:hexosaminidase